MRARSERWEGGQERSLREGDWRETGSEANENVQDKERKTTEETERTSKCA